MTRKAETQYANHALHFRLLEHEAFDLLHDCQRALLRRAWWQLHVHQHGALVFIGQERGGQAHVNHGCGCDDGHVNHQVARGARQHARHATLVTFGGAGKAPVEPAKEPCFGMLVTRFHRFEQRGTQGRREGQRQERRERNRHAHDGGKLTVNIAHRAAEKGQRYKHRNQHHRHANDGARNLAHGLARGLQRRQTFLAHDAFDVLHHHNRVVHHDANHQHHGKHGQHVDGETHGQQRGKGAEQRHRHDQCGNDGVTPVLQKQEHHQKHQRNRLQQRDGHLFNRNLDEA